MVVAAFVGPGTVLTCASAGVRFGYDLAWVILFAVGTTFVLQSFTAGCGILAGKGVGEAMQEAARRPGTRILAVVLVVLGLWIGTAAFETGNMLGASAGMDLLLGGSTGRIYWVVALTLAAGIILALGLRWITHVLTALVALMSVVFLAATLLAPVDWSAAALGLLRPSVPEGSLVTALALVGTTVVAYNLFLHASVAKQYWHSVSAKEAWRRELTGMAIFLPAGGIISVAILFAGSTLQGADANAGSIASLADLLEPAAGSMARILFGLGLFAAGITSAVTAPLAAALGIREIFAWPDDQRSWRFRGVWISVLLTGLVFAILGRNPLEIIVAAQAANGFLLPFMAGFVLYLTMRQREVALPRWYVGLGIIVVVFCAGLGLRTLAWVWSQIGL